MNLDLRKRKNIKISYLPFAFLVPFLGYLLVMMIKNVMPFSENRAFLYSDSYYQYYPFFKEFRRALLSGDSLLYSWNVGMGMDYLGLISYYLASPLNWLLVLVPESWTLELFSLLIPVRIGLAGMFFAIFLKEHFGKNDLSIVAFGSLYATCAWALGYQWNLMWLDSFALLPLLALGTLKLLKDKKYVLYTVVLFLNVFSSYYIGYFNCIFVLLLFIGYQITEFTTLRRFLADFGRIALFTVLALGMTAILELPAIAALGTTSSTVNLDPELANQTIIDKIPDEFTLNIVADTEYMSANGAYTAMRDGLKAHDYAEAWHSFKVMVKAACGGLAIGIKLILGNLGGGIAPNFVDLDALPNSFTGALPNVYCGVVTVYLAVLFLTAKGIKLREKLCCTGMLLLLAVSFLIRPLDFIWHAFHFPNCIPYRYSFLFSFVLLYMAYRAYLLRHKFRLWQLALAGAVSFLVMGFSQNKNDKLFIVFNMVFLALNIGVLCVGLIRRPAPDNATKEEKRKYLRSGIRQRQALSVAMCVVILVEVGMNLANFGTQYPSYALIDNGHFEATGDRVVIYPTGGENVYDMVAIMKEYENRELFYRTETTRCQLYNDGAMLGYNGISTFSSTADVDTTIFLRSLGIGAAPAWNRYAYEQTSPVTNLFLNLKYMIERSQPTPAQNSYFESIYSKDGVTLLKNNAYLPLGFLVQSQFADTQIIPSGKRFNLQNQILKDAAGITEDVWKMQSSITYDSQNVNFDRNSKSFSNGQSAYRCTDCKQVMPYAFKCGSCNAYGTAEGTCSVCQGRVLPANHFPCMYCNGRIDTNIYITYTYTAQQDGLFCVDMIRSNIADPKYYLNNWWCSMENVPYFSVRHNGNYVLSYENVDGLTQMVSLCDVKKGDELEVILHCSANASGSIYLQAAILDDQLFQEAYDILSTSPLKLTTFSNTLIEGVIDCHQDGLLYTSIPDNGNWVAYVDDEKVPVVVIGGAMVGVPLTEGTHTVTFRYESKAFSIGWKISLVCLVVFAAICVVTYKKKQEKGKYEK